MPESDIFKDPFQALLVHELQRIATAQQRIADSQEQLLAIAAEARVERMELSKNMKARMQAGFAQEKP